MEITCDMLKQADQDFCGQRIAGMCFKHFYDANQGQVAEHAN